MNTEASQPQIQRRSAGDFRKFTTRLHARGGRLRTYTCGHCGCPTTLQAGRYCFFCQQVHDHLEQAELVWELDPTPDHSKSYNDLLDIWKVRAQPR